MPVQRKSKARTYVKSRRAEQEAETRQRVVEAAVALHGTVGPARTTITMIADRAGVQRHTVYAHFPDERSLLLACSGLHLKREPPPSPEAWEGAKGSAARLAAAMTALYGWFARNEALLAAVLRDAEINPLLREISQARFGAPMAAIALSVSGGLDAKGRAALTLALDFHAWRTLTRNAGLRNGAAVDLMVGCILTADARPRRARRGAAKKAAGRASAAG